MISASHSVTEDKIVGAGVEFCQFLDVHPSFVPLLSAASLDELGTMRLSGPYGHSFQYEN